MSDFLLELLSEEIPARMQAKARNDLARMFAEALAAAGLAHDGITTYSTPRRLALIAKGLPDATEALSEELKGPRTSAPRQALEGFLRKTGLSQDQLEDRNGVWFARIEKAGRSTGEVLQQRIPSVIFQFPWPKSMRWGQESVSSGSLRWVRPLHNVLAIFGDQHLEIDLSSWADIYVNPETKDQKIKQEFSGVTSKQQTLGHRFHHPGPITIGGAYDYVEKLRACRVLVDHSERETIVRNGAIEAAENAGFVLVEDEGLVVENAGLTEWPVPLLGSFDPDYLDVPEEVIALTARTNQKYFVMRDGGGKLTPHFICTANIDANDGGAAIIAGNERVLAARLSDARFFWEQDLKVPLENQAQKLGAIVFHEKLGTVADKVERVAKLARWLVEEGIIPLPASEGPGVSAERREGSGVQPTPDPSLLGRGELADLAERAARLAKADLVTGMVGEFPELQGVIGGYLARAQGEDDAVADAVRDHYKPVGQGDEVPTAPVTVAVSLADKFDTLVGFFQFGEKPTGSRDPFALRRAALGILSLIIENNIRASMFDLITAAAHEGGADAGRELATFLIDRLKVQQRESGIRHDMIDAVVAVETGGDNVGMVCRVHALQAFIASSEGANLLAGYKRAANILKKETWDAGAAGTADVEPAEAALADALAVAEHQAVAAIEAERFGDAMSALASLRAPIDAFFENVTVNADDAGVRARRLGLLARFRDAVNRVADFSKIES